MPDPWAKYRPLAERLGIPLKEARRRYHASGDNGIVGDEDTHPAHAPDAFTETQLLAAHRVWATWNADDVTELLDAITECGGVEAFRRASATLQRLQLEG